MTLVVMTLVSSTQLTLDNETARRLYDLRIGFVRSQPAAELLAVGASSRTIMALLIMEGVLQGVISWLVAVPLSFVFAQPLASALGQTMIEVDLDYAFNFPFVFVWLAAIVLISILASALPARDAIRVSLRESLAYA